MLLVLGLHVQAAWAGVVTNRLSFQLLAEEIPRDTLIKGAIDPNAVKLQPKPLLSGVDFVAYDTTNHYFWVTPEAARRLSIGSRDRPFVLVALGQPIYVGVLSSPVSSTAYALPTVWAESLVVPAENTNSVGFVVTRGLGRQFQGKGSGTDERNDSRILRAVKELGLPAAGSQSSRQNLEALKLMGGN